MSSKDTGNKCRDFESLNPEELNVGIRHKELMKNKIFSEKLPNMIMTSSPVVAVKDSVNEEKVGKWSFSSLYRMLRIWVRKHLKKRDQEDGFEQNFYTGRSKIEIETRSNYCLSNQILL